MTRRDYQAILDSAFAKLTAAGVSLDHRARWTTPLTGVEKVQLILNDLYCEASRGGFDYWLQRRYCARGHVELQRVTAAIVEAHHAIDPVAAEIVLAMCEAVELSPPSLDPTYAEETGIAADYEAYGRLTSGYGFADACYAEMDERMLRFNEAVVDAWRDEVDPFELPLAREPARARRQIPLIAPLDGPVAFPSATLGVTADGAGCAVEVATANPYTIYQRAGLALYVAGAPLSAIDQLVVECTAVRDDLREVLARCGTRVDLDGTLRRTGRPAEIDAVVARHTAEHAPQLGAAAVAAGGGEELAALMKLPHGIIAVVGGSQAHRRTVTRALLDHIPHNIIAVMETGEPELAQHRNAIVAREELAMGVRAALRWDPDCIAIVPLTRDVAEIAVHGALTGHLMICEIEGPEAVAELAASGCDLTLVAAALAGIVHVDPEAPRIRRVTAMDTARREAIVRREPIEI